MLETGINVLETGRKRPGRNTSREKHVRPGRNTFSKPPCWRPGENVLETPRKPTGFTAPVRRDPLGAGLYVTQASGIINSVTFPPTDLHLLI